MPKINRGYQLQSKCIFASRPRQLSRRDSHAQPCPAFPQTTQRQRWTWTQVSGCKKQRAHERSRTQRLPVAAPRASLFEPGRVAEVVRRQRKADQPTPKLACYGSCGRSGGMRKQMRRPGHRPAVLRCVSHRRSLAAACVSERSLHNTCWGSWWLSRSYPAPSQSSTSAARSSQPRATPRTMKPARHRCTACAHSELRRTGSERACCLEHFPRG